MDDLVVKATAPSHLVGDDRPDSSNRRERNERPERRDRNERRERPERRDRNERRSRPEPAEEQSSEEPAIDSNIEAYPEDESFETPEEIQNDRPERFATLTETQRPERRPVEEFRPSTDGKRAAPKKRVPR